METRKNLELSRRGFLQAGSLGVAVAAAACAPAVPPPSASPGGTASGGAAKAAWEQEWEQLVEAARKEGQLNLVTGVGQGYRDAAMEFEKAFPGITVQQANMNASQFAPKVMQERNAGVYSYDVITSNYGTFGITLIPAGVVDPITPVIFRADVTDDKQWDGGFQKGFIEKQWGYAGFQELYRAVFVNTDLVKDGEVKTVDDLLDPKWKGKMIAGDARVFGGGFWPGTVLRLRRGEDTFKRLWKDQEPVLSRDQRTMIEGMAKGQYAVGIGAVNKALLSEFLSKGVAKNLKYIPLDDMDNLNYTSNIAFMLNRAPHPNAAKLFINWLLSKEGSATWSKYADTNSRRKDVPAAAPELVAPEGRNLMLVDTEEVKFEFQKTMELAKQLLN